MATAYPTRGFGSFLKGLSIQRRVLGALLLRELHSRYGRENVGYLWLIGEPLILAGVMALFHHSGGETAYGSDIKPLPFIVVSYTTYIMFRGIVNRSDASLSANASLLYHKSVSIFDIVFSRALLEAAGTFMTYLVLETFLWSMDWVAWPARWLWLLAAEGLMFWYSLGHAMIIASITFHNRLAERLVHPYTYFMIPLGASFFQVGVIPEPYRSYLLIVPLPHIMEMARYGQFQSADLRYCNIGYVVASCVVLTWIGLVTMRIYRRKVHLS
jgi:capsular polysaccharide transport system permease protein